VSTTGFANELLQLRETLSASPSAHTQLLDELLRAFHTRSELPVADAVDLLVATAGSDSERRAALTDVVGTIARRLAPEDEPPACSDAATVWRMLVAIADRLHRSGVAAMGRLPFISDRLLELMVAEVREQLPERPDSGPRVAAAGGRALAGVAVSGKLREAIGAALGYPVAPGYRALYAYDPPESHVRTHLDSREYEFIFHMILEHDLPADGSPGSALIVHLPNQAAPTRIRLRPGEGVALCGRGTIHSWQRLRQGERRTLIDVGWVSATDPRC
jgi:hypothetical protein